MSLIDAFESSTPEQKLAEGAEEKFDYSQVSEALKHDLTTSENVFARCAKHHFRKLLGPDVELREERGDLPTPLWVHSAAVTLPMSLPLEVKFLASALSDLTRSLAVGILAGNGDVKVVTVGSLNTKIRQVGEGLYTFSLRQKWSLSGR